MLMIIVYVARTESLLCYFGNCLRHIKWDYSEGMCIYSPFGIIIKFGYYDRVHVGVKSFSECAFNQVPFPAMKIALAGGFAIDETLEILLPHSRVLRKETIGSRNSSAYRDRK